MKYLIWMFVFVLGGSACSAETAFQLDASPIYDYFEDEQASNALIGVFESALKGEFPQPDTILNAARSAILETKEAMLFDISAAVGVVILMALLRVTLTEGKGAGMGVRYLLRLELMLKLSKLATTAIEASGGCIQTSSGLSDVAAPLVITLFTAAGMSMSSAMVSPAAALSGNIAEKLFLNIGIPVCRVALCIVLAGSLSNTIDLNRVSKLLKKGAAWGSGLLIALFTAFIALQGSVAETMDGIGMRTAKYAFDSASGIIGSGVSDAWDSYVSGIMVTKNALGISGITAILIIGIKPVAYCLCAMLVLQLISAMLALFGEKESADLTEQLAGICQMAMSFSTASLVIGTVLIGAAMAAGRNLIA